jgi:4-amino-4-deoxy-L-arabinose transferase-like glycosyltransferase
MAVIGTLSVGLVGLVGLEAFGAGAGLAAMVIAALYPVMIELSGALVAENLVVTLELAAAWTALRACRARRPSVWLAGTGVLTGLAALTHENAILDLLPFAYVAWTAARRRSRSAAGPVCRARLRALGAPVLVVVGAAAMIAPWTIRNAEELHAFVPISDETGITLAGTYNSLSADDPLLPYKWHLFSHVPAFQNLARTSGSYTEPALDNKLTGLAFSYIGAHPLAPVEVFYDNTRRMLELEGTYAWHASAAAIGLHGNVAEIGVYSFYVLCALSLLGLTTPAVRRGPKWLWAMPVLWWFSIVLINVETPRFREPIDPFLVLLAGCAVAAALGRLGSGLRRAPVRSGGRAPELAGDAESVEMVERLA